MKKKKNSCEVATPRHIYEVNQLIYYANPSYLISHKRGTQGWGKCSAIVGFRMLKEDSCLTRLVRRKVLSYVLSVNPVEVKQLDLRCQLIS